MPGLLTRILHNNMRIRLLDTLRSGCQIHVEGFPSLAAPGDSATSGLRVRWVPRLGQSERMTRESSLNEAAVWLQYPSRAPGHHWRRDGETRVLVHYLCQVRGSKLDSIA